MEELNEKSLAAKWTDNQLLLIAFLFRLFLILYANLHDYLFELSFTDIDYHVFSDAAFLVSQGDSPYDKSTYRYTPLIAWALIPNRFFANFGKLLFAIIDVLVGWFQMRVLGVYSPSKFMEGQSILYRRLIYILWLFNPFNAIISTRGNSDSLICLLILWTLYALGTRQNLFVSALIYAGSIHLRIFPLIYIPSIFLSLSSNFPYKWQGIKNFLLRDCLANRRGFAFLLISFSVFAFFIAFFYNLYGYKFLESFLLYHLTRIDVRHNFSPYFLPFYLFMNRPDLTRLLGIMAFIPQATFIISFAFRYVNDLPFCWFLSTFAFVSLNKVSTSQYFMWYLCLLPIIYQKIKMTHKEMLFLFTIWLAGQGHWLIAAYLLEFRGMNTFIWIWIASLYFLIINFYIMMRLIQTYSSTSLIKNEKLKE